MTSEMKTNKDTAMSHVKHDSEVTMEQDTEDLQNADMHFTNAHQIFDKLRNAGFIKDNNEGKPIDDTFDVIEHVLPLEGVKVTDEEGQLIKEGEVSAYDEKRMTFTAYLA